MANATEPNYDPVSLTLESLHDTICLGSRDYSLNHRDAWIYGIVVGWDEALPEVAEKHRWSTETISRLESMHKIYKRLKDNKSE